MIGGSAVFTVAESWWHVAWRVSGQTALAVLLVALVALLLRRAAPRMRHALWLVLLVRLLLPVPFSSPFGLVPSALRGAASTPVRTTVTAEALPGTSSPTTGPGGSSPAAEPRSLLPLAALSG